MKALVIDNGLKLVNDFPKPELKEGFALVKILTAGICKTDIELLKGYEGFKGIPGHEFLGIVEECNEKRWIGKRVTSEINFGCGVCEWCRKEDGRHCPDKTVLGIRGIDGAMAEYCLIPVKNLIDFPDYITDERAIFIEPLAAACRIREQIRIRRDDKIAVLGDGKLGVLISWVLSTIADDVTIIGHHQEKLDVAAWNGITTSVSLPENSKFDIVVEATGSVNGLEEAISICKPLGTIILKTTSSTPIVADLSKVVVNEIKIIGSRCGQFRDAMQILRSYEDMPLEKLLTETFNIDDAISAFEKAAVKNVFKVLITF